MLVKETVVTFYTTPDELRSMADLMEKKIKQLQLGDSVVMIHYEGEGVSLNFTLAQGK